LAGSFIDWRYIYLNLKGETHMTRVAAQEPSDLVLSSVTETQEQLDHAVGENWKQPFVPEAEKKALEEKAKVEEEVKAKLAEEKPPAEEKEVEEHEEHEEIPGKGGWSKRVNKLTARNARLAEEVEQERTKREDLERRLAALERGDKPAARQADDGPAIADLPNKPKRIDFKDEEKYVESLIQWTKANEDNREAVAEEQARMQKVFDAHRERLIVARETHDDWDAVAKAAEHMILQPSVDLAIREMENSAEVLYYLATHPEEYEKMSKLTPLMQVGQAVRISDRLAAPANGNGNGNRKPRAIAAEPITPGGKRPTKSSVKLEDMQTDDYLAARRQMRAQRRAN
jgi:hypothetical protein